MSFVTKSLGYLAQKLSGKRLAGEPKGGESKMRKYEDNFKSEVV